MTTKPLTEEHALGAARVLCWHAAVDDKDAPDILSNPTTVYLLGRIAYLLTCHAPYSPASLEWREAAEVLDAWHKRNAA